MHSHDFAADVEALAELGYRRKVYIGLVNKQTNAAKALVRRAIGWQWDEEEERRTAINARASVIITRALTGKPQKADDDAIAAAVAFDLAVLAEGLKPFERARHEIELEMKRIARRLPVWKAWAKSVKGLGDLGLAVIVAEAGDLAKYTNPGKVWKRLGLAPYNGKAASTWRYEGGLSADEWTAFGYSPRRRAEMYAVVGEPLFRVQTPIKGPYRVIYDLRRARTAETHADWRPARSHADGLRIMTKTLIRDLWVASREANRHAEPVLGAPPADLSRVAGDEPARASDTPSKPNPRTSPAFSSAGDPAGTEGQWLCDAQVEAALGPLSSADEAERPATRDSEPIDAAPGAILSADEADAEGQATCETRSSTALGESLSPDEKGERSATIPAEPTLSPSSAILPVKAGERRAGDRPKPATPTPAAHSPGDEPERPTIVQPKPNAQVSVATPVRLHKLSDLIPISEEHLSGT